MTPTTTRKGLQLLRITLSALAIGALGLGGCDDNAGSATSTTTGGTTAGSTTSGGVGSTSSGSGATSAGTSSGSSSSTGSSTGTSTSTSGSSSGTSSGGTSSGSTSSGTSSSGTSTSGGTTGSIVEPGDPGTNDVLFAVDSTANAHAISPYIYGTNQGDMTAEAKGLTLARVGGNRLTAYNWETNASNAGSDYLYENDNFYSDTVAGKSMKDPVTAANAAGASIVMTVPIAGWVAGDEKGTCPSDPTAAQIAARFVPISAAKGAAFVYPPDTTDGNVYADEFVSWLEGQFPKAQTDDTQRIFYELDNEPDAWASTHSEIHPTPVTYAELIQKNIDYATAIKAVAPKAVVFGPVNYGYTGYVNLQFATDAKGKDWLNTYLDAMQAADTAAGKRLIDVLDLHWYPEATGGGNRITLNGGGVTAAEVAARVQAPRSLWDPNYVETSWIADYLGGGAIDLIPSMMDKISKHYPGTKLAFTEYNYGAGGDISGGVAEADVLGIFGREGVFAATMWELGSKNDFLFAGFDMYVNYDGAGATFGDTSVSATASDDSLGSVYASVSSTDGTNIIVVAINKSTAAKVAGITLRHTATLSNADVYTLTKAADSPQAGTALTSVDTNAFSYSMPAMSVTTLVFRP